MNNIIDYYSERTSCLEEVREIFDGYNYIGYTINLPRVKKFIQLSTMDQMIMYKYIMKNVLNKTEKKMICRYIYTFELCKDGMVHMHGMIEYDKCIGKRQSATGDLHHIGLMMDIDRNIRIVINKVLKLKVKYKNQYNDQYKRIRKPSHCLQLMRDYIETDRWFSYIHKYSRRGEPVGEK